MIGRACGAGEHIANDCGGRRQRWPTQHRVGVDDVDFGIAECAVDQTIACGDLHPVGVVLPSGAGGEGGAGGGGDRRHDGHGRGARFGQGASVTQQRDGEGRLLNRRVAHALSAAHNFHAAVEHKGVAEHVNVVLHVCL